MANGLMHTRVVSLSTAMFGLVLYVSIINFGESPSSAIQRYVIS